MTGISRAEAKEEIERLEKGMASMSKSLYVYPNEDAERVCKIFMDRFRSRKSGLLSVKGGTGAGKTRLINTLKADLRQEKMAISHITLYGAEELRKLGVPAFLPHQLIKAFSLYDDGQEKNFLESIENDSFRQKVHAVFEDPDKNNALYYGGSRHLAVVFDCLTGPDPELRQPARRWLEGSTPSSEDEVGKAGLKGLRAKGLETNAKSVSAVTTDETLYFLRNLAKELGFSPYLVIVDEIEKAAELPPKMGRTFLSGIRDLINLLYATDRDLPQQNGLFVVVSISDQYLNYAGIATEVPSLVQPGGREKFGKPKTDLRDVPRLWTVLNGIRSWADVNISSKAKMIEIGERVKALYKDAYDGPEIMSVDVAAVVERWYPVWPELLPRWYIPVFLEECRKAAAGTR